MRAHEGLCRPIHTLDRVRAQGARNVPAAILLKRVADGGGKVAILILLGQHRIAGMEIIGHKAGVRHRDVARQIVAQRPRDVRGGDRRGKIELSLFGNGGAKGAGVDTRIGAATAHDVTIVAKEGARRLVEGTLNGRDASRLNLIAVIGRSDEAELDHRFHTSVSFLINYIV